MWEELDKKEKELCQEHNLKPEDYLQLKKSIQLELYRNKSLSETMIKEKGKEIKNVREKVPAIYEFWVRTNLITAAK